MTENSTKIEEMTKLIASIRKDASELKEISCGIQAVDRNVDRILSSVKMLEINVSDLLDIL